MIKNITQTTTYTISDKNQERIRKLEKAKELMCDVLNDDEFWDNLVAIRKELCSVMHQCDHVKRECEKLFTVVTVETVEETID